MAMTLEELRRKAGTSRQGVAVSQPSEQKMTLDELRRKAGVTAPVQQKPVQNTVIQPTVTQTAGEKSPAVSYAEKLAEEKKNQPTQKYGLIDGKVVLPSYIENQGLYAAPGTEKSKVNYLMDSAAKGLVGGALQTGEAIWQDLSGEAGKAEKAYYDYVMESAYNPQKAGQMAEYRQQMQTARQNEKLNTDTLGYKLLESSDADMAKATEGMGATGQFLTGVMGSTLQNAYLIPLAVINPAAATVIMSLSAAGRTTKEQSEKGKALNRSLVRGAIDGTIEYFTEKLPMEAIAKRLTGQGDNIIKLVFQQAYSEAGEEGLSYLAGYAADKLEKDPDAKFSMQELLLNMLAGGLSGAMLGGGTAAIGGIANIMAATQQAQPKTEQLQQNITEENTIINDNPLGHSTEEIVDIDSYKAATDPKMMAFIQKARSLKDTNVPSKISENVGTVKDTEAQEINRITGIDVSGYKRSVKGDRILHIDTKHGRNGKADQSLAETEDIARMQWVMDNYDEIVQVIDTEGNQAYSEFFNDKDNKKAPLIAYAKAIDGVYYIVEAVPDSASKTLQLESARIIKKEVYRELNGVNYLSTNVQNGHGLASSNGSIPQTEQNVQDAADENFDTAKDINVPGKDVTDINVGTRTAMSMEDAKQQVRNIGADVLQQEAIKAEAVKKGQGDTIEQIEAFAKRTGVNVHYYNGQLGQKHLGFREGNDIYIDLREKDVMLKTAVHETIHALKSNNSKAYDKLYGQIDALQKNSTRFNVLAEMTGEKYADAGVVDTEANSEEIVAKLSEAIIENPEEFLRKFGKERTFVDAVIDFLKEIKNTIVAKFGGSKAEAARVDNALIALEQYLRNEAGETDSNVQFAVFIDDKGKTKEYNIKWATDNKILTKRELANLSEKLQNKAGYKQVSDGKIVAVGEEYGVNNKLLFFKDYTTFSDLEKIVVIWSDDETIIAPIREDIYGTSTSIYSKSTQYVSAGYPDVFIGEYFKSDSKKFQKDRSKFGKTGSTRSQNNRDFEIIQDGNGNDRENSKIIENGTPQGVSSSFAENNGTVTNKNGDVLAVDNNGSTQFNIRTFEDGGREYLERYLAKQSDLTAEDKADILSSIDSIYDMVKEYNTAMSSEYPSFTNWCEAKPVIDDNGNVVMSVIVPNGDYKMNIDVSTVCKKRKALDVVLNKMAESGDLSVYSMSQPDIVKMNQIIKRHGFEVACAMCFVDAKRYRIGNWANSFADMYNSIVETIIPEGSDIVLDQFNYSGAKIKKVKGRKADSVKTTELRWDEVNRMIDDKNVKPIMREMAKAIKTNPSMRRMLSGGDLISSKGMDNLKVQNPELYKLTNRHMGTAKPKTSHSETPYTNEILKASGWTPEKAYAVGGVRIQSFSDYMANMFFDYAQIIADLSAKKLPGHGYTKELDFAKIFGLTGLKINMSAMPKAMDIPADIRAELNKLSEAKRKEHPLYKYYKERAGLDARGNYLWADESIDVEEAIKLQNSDGYEKNCGIICVGISDAHIRKLMADDNMKMVIPYHKSGINPVVAKMQNIDLYTDYTNEQNTRYAKSGKKLRKNSFQFDFYADLAQTKDPRTTAENYVRDCENRNFLPKFDRFAYKLDADGNRIKGKDGRYVVDENYYKLLIDFRVYDNAGNYAPQGAIKMSYPQNLDQLVKESLKASEATAAKMDKGIDALLKDIKKEISIKDSDRVNTKPVYSGNYDIKFDTQASIDIGNEDAKAEGKYKGKSIKEISEGTISESQQRRAKAQERMEQRQQQTAKLVPEKFAKAQAKKAEDGLPESVGAMKSGYHAAIEKYGAFPEGEKATNPVDVPMSVDGEHGVTRGVRTIMEAEATKEDMLADFQKAIAEGDFNYEINRDKDAVDKAVNYIEKYGYKDAYEGWRKKVDNKQTITKDDMTQAQIMYASAVEYGDYDTAMKLATDISIQATKAGQVVQSMRILKKTTPDGRLYYAKKSLEAVQDEVNEKYGDNAPELKVDDKLWENLREAQTDEAIREATAKFNQAIADQLPFSWSNFIASWRYLAMLGNTRTQLRNVFSNCISGIAQEWTNFVQTAGETAFVKAGANIERTSAIKTTEWQRKQAEADFKAVEKDLYGKGKFRNDNLTAIQKLQNPFDFKGKGGKAGEIVGKGLTAWNNATNKAMETGDKWFSEPAYKRYYARYLAANKINSEEQLTSKVKLRARAWATKQANESVFRESNALAEWIGKQESQLLKSTNPGRKTAAKLVGGLMPFRNTPLNITKRAFEYTPVGILTDLGWQTYSNKRYGTDYNITQTINKAAKSFSGTVLIALGYALAKHGILTGGLGDDKEDKMKKQMGQQEYALNTENWSMTMDWAGAGVMPLFVGAQMYQMTEEESDGFFMAMLDTLANASAPVMETSMMTGLMSAINDARYEKDPTKAFMTFLASGLGSYIGQFVPTALGQFSRAIDDTSRTAYTTTKGVIRPLAKTAEKMQNKTPWSVLNVPYMDVWGNDTKNFDFGIGLPGRLFYNMVSPGYIEKKSTDKVETMLMELYEKTGETSVLPSNYTTSKKVDGENIRFTDKQFEQYTKAYGQTAYNQLKELSSDKRFAKLTDEEKVAAIEDIYKYSSKVASKETVNVEMEKTMANKNTALKNGVSSYDVFAGKDIADKEGNNNSHITDAEAVDYINNHASNLTDVQKAYLFNVIGGDKGYSHKENVTFVNTYVDTVKSVSKGISKSYRDALSESVYSYAAEIAKDAAGINDASKGAINKRTALEKGVSAEYVFAGKDKADSMGNGNGYTSKEEAMSYIETLGLSPTEKAYLFAALGNSNWKNPYI